MEDQIGHYRIVRELGRGAMGVVYLAHEDSLNRTVALKVLAPTFTESGEDFQRFHLEARSLAQLNHRNIVQIYFVGEDGGRHFFAMEYVPSSLQQTLGDAGRIESSRAAQLVLNAATGLAAAHERGIVHRDVKPANLLVAEDGILKVADFGIARIAAASTRLTANDAILGTPRYISPEQCEGAEGDPRSDIYSLGVTYYEMLTGRAPYRSTSALALVREILQDTPPSIEEVMPEIDDRTRTIVGKMMAKSPADRYQSAGEVAADLQAHLLSRIMPDWDGRSSFQPPAGAPLAAAPPPSPPLAAAPSDATVPIAPPTSAVPLDPPPVPRPSLEAVDDTGTWKESDGGDRTVVLAEGAVPRRPTSALWVVAALAVLFLAGAITAAALWQRGSGGLATASIAAATERLFGADEASEEQQAVALPAAPIAGEPAARSEDAAGPEAEEWTPAPGHATPRESHAAPAGRPAPTAANRDDAPAASMVERRPPSSGRHAPTGSSRPAVTARDEPLGRAEPGRAASSATPRGVAVAVWGDDPLIAGVLEDYLRSHLDSEFELVVGATMAETAVQGQPPPEPYLAAARDLGARHVVLATTTFLRATPLYYYGQEDTLYQSRVTLESVDTASHDRLTRWSGIVEYAALQTEASLEEAIKDPMAELIEALRR